MGIAFGWGSRGLRGPLCILGGGARFFKRRIRVGEGRGEGGGRGWVGGGVGRRGEGVNSLI